MPSGKRTNAQPYKIAATLSPGDFITYIGLALVGIAFTILFTTFWPVIREELGYNVKQTIPALQKRNLIPVDRNFGVVIPKIGANSLVVPNVNPFNSREYQVALTRGVAHAKGSTKPGEPGNVFLFSHSSVNFYEAAQYNSVFYLLNKLEKGDLINLYYKDTKYIYAVTSKMVVKPTAVEYLKAMDNNRETVTLMTCWPPGTTAGRLLIIAERNK